MGWLLIILIILIYMINEDARIQEDKEETSKSNFTQDDAYNYHLTNKDK